MEAVQWTDALLEQAEGLCRVARECSRRGWLPATAGNFSFRDQAVSGQAAERIFITPSGIDKGGLEAGQLLEIGSDGGLVAGPEGAKPSAEIRLHGVIYRDRPQTRAVFHVHTVANHLMSDRNFHNNPAHPGRSAVSLAGYGLLKALSGVVTHDHRELVPILEDSQDDEKLSRELSEVLRVHPAAHGVLLHRQGLYAWGGSIAECWRHLEALEFLFEVESRRLPREA